MVQFGSASRERLNTCNPNIQEVMFEVINLLPWTDPLTSTTIKDCTIIEGHRTLVRQNYLYDTRKSQVRWPNSKHNCSPSNAVDAAPYHDKRPHIHWNNKDEFGAFSRLVLTVATTLEISLRWGGDWDQDGVRVDRDPHEKFFDGPHFEENI
jgi:peptidoglycan L-alanyl-D-glutamate endopeptidase CwlK